MQPLSTLDTTKPINFDDLNIIIRSLPPQRRQSGTSIIPFRPYVKRLTSVRQPFSFANGRDGWITIGEKVAFFKQENARCIGSLVSDCETSEVIRWDIEGESTRLPMMCKLWMIVDGAVVERGKPRMVQDAAVQVYRAGQSLLAVLASQYRQYDQTVVTRYDRRRRHSWHDVNEYHSIPYFQYTSSIKPGPPKFIQCDIDNEQQTSQVQYLPFITEEMAEEQYMDHTEEHNAYESIHDQEVPRDRVQISMTTRTEHALNTGPASIESALRLSSYQTYEVSKTFYGDSAYQSHDMASGTSDDISYSNRSVATHDDIHYSSQSISTRDHAEYTHQSIATGNDVEYADESSSTQDNVSYSNQSVATRDDIHFASQAVSTRDHAEYTHQSIATGNDTEYADGSSSTQDNVSYSNRSVATHDDIHFSHQSISTRDDAEYTHKSIATGHDLEYADESVSTQNIIEYSNQSVATADDIKFSNQSSATHDDAQYHDQSVSTRDDILYSDRSMSTYDDVKYADQSVATHDNIEYSDRSMSTYDDVKYSNQAVATHDHIGYSDCSVSTYDDVTYTNQAVSTHDHTQQVNQSVSTRDDLEYATRSVGTNDGIEYCHQSVATHDGLQYSHQSVATSDDIEYANRAVSTRDDAEHTHHSIATGSDVEYANQSSSTRDDVAYVNQSISTHDDVQYANQSVSTRDNHDQTHQSIATGNDLEYATQSVSTRDDLQYTHRSTGTQDDTGYASQSVSTRDDFECANQSVSTHDDIAYLHQSVSTRDDLELLNQSVSTRDDFEYLNQSVSTHDDVHYSSRSIATGTDYPDFWLQFTTSEVLSELIVSQSDGRESSILSSRQHDQSIQTETEQDTDVESEKPRPSSSRSSRTAKSSSSVTISNHYQVVDQIDDESQARTSPPYGAHRRRLDSHGDSESHFSYNPIETSSTPDTARSGRGTSSLGYHSFESAAGQQAISTPDLYASLACEHTPTYDISHVTRKAVAEMSSISSLESLSERYERTLRDRRKAMAVINDELLDVGDVVERYRERVRDSVSNSSNRTTRVARETITPPPKEERSLSPLSSSSSSRSRYRFVSSVASEEMTPDYLPPSRIYLTESIVDSPRQVHPHVCEICLTDHSSGSAWIRYNEHRLEQVQQRIDLMLEMEDVDDEQLTYSTLNSAATTTQRIDDILRGRTRYNDQTTFDRNQTITPYRYNYGSSYRAKSMSAASPRLPARKLTRSASPASKRVRISTTHVLIPNQTRHREPIASSKSVPRPIVSILRRSNPTLPTRSQRYLEAPPEWRNESRRQTSMVDQWTIPRYYRLYNDVGFREVYDFSRVLNSCMNRTSPRDYSSMVHNYAMADQFPSPITSVA